MKNKHKLIGFTLVATMMLQSLAFAQEKTKISTDGFNITANVAPEEIDDKLFVGLKDIATSAGATVTWHDPSKTATVEKGKKVFQVTQDENYIFVDGNRVDISYTPYTKDGNLMVPLNLITEQLDIKAEYNKEENIIIIDTGRVGSEKIIRQESEGTPITIEEATELAKKNDTAIKNLLDDFKIEESDKNALSNQFMAYAQDNSSVIGNHQDIAMIVNLKKADLSAESQKYQKKLAEDTIAASIKGSFNNILSSENKLVYNKIAAQNSKKLLDITEKKYELGLESKYNYDKQKVAYEQELKDIENLELKLKTDYIKLNNTINPSGKKDYIISYNVTEYIPLEDMDINVYASQNAYNSPAIRIKKLDIEGSQFALDHTTQNDYDSKLNALNKSKRALSDTEDTFKEKVKTKYNDILLAEKNYDKLLEDMEQLKLDLDLMKVKYNSGLVSVIDIENLELKITAKELEIKDSIINLDSLKYTFERPYLL